MPRPKPLEEVVTVAVKTPISLRNAFILACQQNYTTASDVLRKTMVDYVANHQTSAHLSAAAEEEDI